jgi:hypothetical protein
VLRNGTEPPPSRQLGFGPESAPAKIGFLSEY